MFKVHILDVLGKGRLNSCEECQFCLHVVGYEKTCFLATDLSVRVSIIVGTLTHVKIYLTRPTVLTH